MTALIMPSDYGMEMLIGSSPVLGSSFLGGPSYFSELSNRCSPVWNHAGLVSCSTESVAVTTITAKHLNGTSTYMGFNPSNGVDSAFGIAMSAEFNRETSPLARCGSSRRNSKRDSMRRRKAGVTQPPPLFNLKSCLSNRTEEAAVCEGAISPSKEKKRVSFADMLGQELARIKIITERPDCPPKWSSDFLEQVTGGAKPEALSAQWELSFSQPAADYLGWKDKLERDNVALENVFIKTSDKVTGTIKVRNIAFHKQVLIRYTTSNWLSSDEVEANYLPTKVGAGSYNIYDSFAFEIPLPSSTNTDRVEFCICYQTDGEQFWDNNDNKNYAVVSFSSKTASNGAKKPTDIYDIDLKSWSEFSAWNHLDLKDARYY